MSEGFELGAFHVPQQSRRDKLRSLEGCTGLHSVYDPMVGCVTGDSFIHPQGPLSLHPAVKEENLSLMGFGQTFERSDPFFSSSSSSCSSSSSSTSSSSSHLLFDLPPSLSINPGSSMSNPFLYAASEPSGFRDFNQSFHDARALFKPPQTFPMGQSSMLATQGLSLSLSSHTFNGDASMLGDKGVGSYAVIGGDISRSAGPVGPFTGYAEVLKGSRFLKPAQQLLAEYCNVGQGAYFEKISAMDVEMERMSDSEIIDDPVGVGPSADSGEYRRKKTRLISMLDEVYRRYKQYHQQMQAVVASFESVHGLTMAAPFTSLALKTLSKHFQCLKDAINDQLRKSIGEESFVKDDVPKFRIIDHSLHHQQAAHSPGILEQPHIWRPQRGLPERAVAVLRAWLFEHFLHPYPTDTDKQMLAKQTGLSRNQVSNWFINARVRLWKPMVEEIHSLEMSQGQKVSEGDGQNVNKQSSSHVDPIITSSEPFQNSSIKRNQDISAKRCGNELSEIPNGSGQLMNFTYDSMASHLPPVGVGGSMARGNAGVSLTLGLHQNNVTYLSEPLPLAVPHFGIEESNNAYGFGGFDNQSRQLKRDLGGHYLHDFVG
ncbi:BEL1-like homeodomain protein 9 [Aristolochia californica]|uniref:BEL1-like homeodomain protein 9 n=1 Tax=Aristolochia californica TaxID=171875 RepID=UPI0035E214C3